MKNLKEREEVIEYSIKINTNKLSPLRSGNISVRGIEEGIEGFFITPSGKKYESLKPEDIVFLSLTEEKDHLNLIWVLLSIIGSGVAVYLLRTSLNPILNFMVVTLLGSLFVMMTHQAEVMDMGVIENEIPTIDVGSADTKSFFKRAAIIKLLSYLLIALPFCAYVVVPEPQLLKDYMDAVGEFFGAFN